MTRKCCMWWFAREVVLLVIAGGFGACKFDSLLLHRIVQLVVCGLVARLRPDCNTDRQIITPQRMINSSCDCLIM